MPTPARRTHPARSERGSASVQMVVIMPLLFGIAFTGLQAGLYFYGRSTAMSAAASAARAGAAEHGTLESCRQAAAAFIAQLGDVLTNPRIDCGRTGDTVTVVVSGTTLSVIPGWTPWVEQRAARPMEKVS